MVMNENLYRHFVRWYQEGYDRNCDYMIVIYHLDNKTYTPKYYIAKDMTEMISMYKSRPDEFEILYITAIKSGNMCESEKEQLRKHITN